MTRQRFIIIASVVGLVVLTVVLIISSLAVAQTARLDSFQRTGDPRKLVVNLTIGLADEIAERTVREDERSVTVTVRLRHSTGSYPALGVYVPVLVSLTAPLGDRVVLDSDGTAVRDLGEIYRPPGTTPKP